MYYNFSGIYFFPQLPQDFQQFLNGQDSTSHCSNIEIVIVICFIQTVSGMGRKQTFGIQKTSLETVPCGPHFFKSTLNRGTIFLSYCRWHWSGLDKKLGTPKNPLTISRLSLSFLLWKMLLQRNSWYLMSNLQWLSCYFLSHKNCISWNKFILSILNYTVNLRASNMYLNDPYLLKSQALELLRQTFCSNPL